MRSDSCARRIERADACFKSKEFDRAIAEYSEVIRIIEKEGGGGLIMLATTYHSRSLAYRQRGDSNSAEADLRAAMRIGYDNASIRHNENSLGIPYGLRTRETEPIYPLKRVNLAEALKAMRPYMRMGVMLERIWPPGSTSTSQLSQIGGFPSWPANWKWPSMTFRSGKEVSLDFLAQVNLSELPDVEELGLLPKGGMLYFFALSQSHKPLGALGRDAWRVLYYPENAAALARQPPPPDAGWNLDEMDHTRSPAAKFRDPDRRELIPRCPVRPVAAPTWAYPGSSDHEDAERFWRAAWTSWSGSAPPPKSFAYDQRLLPSHVEDALLQLNYARNAWFEGVVDFEHVAQGRGVQALGLSYHGWHDRVTSLVGRLQKKGRATALTELERSEVCSLVTECSALLKPSTGRSLDLDPKGTCITSLATLLLDHPEVANDRADEVAAAHPAYVAATGSETHRMLGYSFKVQDDIPKGSVLLLQLGSDRYGPRFGWWDVGNITFWISKKNLASLRFDRATAEIQGY